MRILIVPAIAIFFALSFHSCKSSSGPKTFCDTTCLKDTLKFTNDYKLKPYVYIISKNCNDSIIWSYAGMEINRKVGVTDFLNTRVYINKDYVKCFIKDTAYAWLLFNDCATGRGYSLKLPFNKSASIGRKSSNINNLDPKFSLSGNMTAYTDRGNIYVEDMETGKKAMMTFGEKLDIDYDAIHEYIDSVNVTPDRIWVKAKIGGAWKELEKKITLE